MMGTGGGERTAPWGAVHSQVLRGAIKAGVTLFRPPMFPWEGGRIQVKAEVFLRRHVSMAPSREMLCHSPAAPWGPSARREEHSVPWPPAPRAQCPSVTTTLSAGICSLQDLTGGTCAIQVSPDVP